MTHDVTHCQVYYPCIMDGQGGDGEAVAVCGLGNDGVEEGSEESEERGRRGGGGGALECGVNLKFFLSQLIYSTRFHFTIPHHHYYHHPHHHHHVHCYNPSHNARLTPSNYSNKTLLSVFNFCDDFQHCTVSCCPAFIFH